MTSLSFKDHQFQFTAHIRNPEKNPIPDGVEDRRIAIYRDPFYNNIEGFIASGFPVIRSIYNDENWHEMISDFFANHKARPLTFWRFRRSFSPICRTKETQDYDPAGFRRG